MGTCNANGNTTPMAMCNANGNTTPMATCNANASRRTAQWEIRTFHGVVPTDVPTGRQFSPNPLSPSPQWGRKGRSQVGGTAGGSAPFQVGPSSEQHPQPPPRTHRSSCHTNHSTTVDFCLLWDRKPSVQTKDWGFSFPWGSFPPLRP